MIFQNNKFLLIAGPCSLESKDLSFKVAETLAALAQKRKDELVLVFKGSFDKANRTSVNGNRGTGIEEGLAILEAVKKEFNLPVLTDIHQVSHCEKAGEVCDALQIPAFLCRQTDLLVAAAKTGKTINVKKGQFLSPQEMKYVVSKLRDSKAAEIWQTDRGSSFGYQNLVVDMRSFAIMKENKTPVILDATHATQLPGAGEGCSGGERKYVALLAKAAVAAGADGLFIETHPEPEKAISDAATQLPLADLEALLDKCMAIRNILKI